MNDFWFIDRSNINAKVSTFGHAVITTGREILKKY